MPEKSALLVLGTVDMQPLANGGGGGGGGGRKRKKDDDSDYNEDTEDGEEEGEEEEDKEEGDGAEERGKEGATPGTDTHPPKKTKLDEVMDITESMQRKVTEMMTASEERIKNKSSSSTLKTHLSVHTCSGLPRPSR